MSFGLWPQLRMGDVFALRPVSMKRARPKRVHRLVVDARDGHESSALRGYGSDQRRSRGHKHPTQGQIPIEQGFGRKSRTNLKDGYEAEKLGRESRSLDFARDDKH
jgi:hypothetical protein